MSWWNLFHGVSWVSREISMNIWPTWNEWSFGCSHPPFLFQLQQIRKVCARNQILAFSCLDKGYGEDKTRLKGQEATDTNCTKGNLGRNKQQLFSMLGWCSIRTGAWNVCGTLVLGDFQHSANKILRPHELIGKCVLLETKVGPGSSRDPFQHKWLCNSNKHRRSSVILIL